VSSVAYSDHIVAAIKIRSFDYCLGIQNGHGDGYCLANVTGLNYDTTGCGIVTTGSIIWQEGNIRNGTQTPYCNSSNM